MIYTSNYSRASRLDRTKYYLVQISATAPKWFDADDAIPALFPDYSMVKGYKEGRVSEESYTDRYKVRLVGREVAIRSGIHWAKDFAQGRDVVLLCWCSKGAFCHRRLFAEWWEALTGEQVREL